MYSVNNKNVLIAGGGGFIGGALTKELIARGARSIRSVDIKPYDEWFIREPDVENLVLDLSELSACERATKDVDVVFNLAADMGGMGFIELNKALCMLSVLINTHLLKASVKNDVPRFFFSSSACVYRADRQLDPNNPGLAEHDAYPASPEDGYGWEKLFSERMCRHFKEDFGIETRVARFHNVYGPHGTYDGGREKAPAAICRKIATALLSGHHEIEIWGDGEQTRSFTYIDDTVYGTLLLTESDYAQPINIGSNEIVTINQMVSIVEQIAGIQVKRTYNLGAPRGVRGRNSDNSIILSTFNWQPSVSLSSGLKQTFEWVLGQLKESHQL